MKFFLLTMLLIEFSSPTVLTGPSPTLEKVKKKWPKASTEEIFKTLRKIRQMRQLPNRELSKMVGYFFSHFFQVLQPGIDEINAWGSLISDYENWANVVHVPDHMRSQILFEIMKQWFKAFNENRWAANIRTFSVDNFGRMKDHFAKQIESFISDLELSRKLEQMHAYPKQGQELDERKQAKDQMLPRNLQMSKSVEMPEDLPVQRQGQKIPTAPMAEDSPPKGQPQQPLYAARTYYPDNYRGQHNLPAAKLNANFPPTKEWQQPSYGRFHDHSYLLGRRQHLPAVTTAEYSSNSRGQQQYPTSSPYDDSPPQARQQQYPTSSMTKNSPPQPRQQQYPTLAMTDNSPPRGGQQNYPTPTRNVYMSSQGKGQQLPNLPMPSHYNPPRPQQQYSTAQMTGYYDSRKGWQQPQYAPKTDDLLEEEEEEERINPNPESAQIFESSAQTRGYNQNQGFSPDYPTQGDERMRQWPGKIPGNMGQGGQLQQQPPRLSA